MGNIVTARTEYQIGKETTPGTAVAATQAITAPIEFEPLNEIDRPQFQRGYTMRNSGDETAMRKAYRWTLPEHPISFEEMIWWLSMSVEGGVTPTGATASKTWVFDRALNSIVVPDTYTLERLMHDGTTALQHKLTFLFAESWTVSVSEGGLATFSATGLCNTIQSLTTFASIAQPTRTLVPSHRAVLSFDVSWATIGTTQYVNDGWSARLTYNTGLQPHRTLNNNANLDFTRLRFDARQSGVDYEVSTVMQPSGDLYNALKTAMEGLVRLAARLKMEGGDIGDGTNYELDFDMMLMGTIAGLDVSGSENGQQIATATFQESPDGTNPWLQVTAINAETTL